MALNLKFDPSKIYPPKNWGGYNIPSVESRFLLALDRLYHPEKYRSIEREFQRVLDSLAKKSGAI